MTLRVLHSLIFFPRGGSAHVARALTRQAQLCGVDARIVSGSLGHSGEQTHAATFYGESLGWAMDYSAAGDAHARGEDAVAQPWPFHPSYEDRGDVPDRIFADVRPALAEWLVDRWRSIFEDVRADFVPDVVHVHHLTPQLPAIRSVFPSVPIVVHLHGTELKMLELIRSKGGGEYEYSQFWIDFLVEVASIAQHTVVVSATDREKAIRLLGLHESSVTVVPNGVDTERFLPLAASLVGRATMLERVLVDDPAGTLPGGQPGSVRYSASAVEGLAAAVVFAYVGRFTAVKRVDLLITAFAQLESRGHNVALLIFGGFPGEWEGEHPWLTAHRVGARRVFFAGWRPQDDLPAILPHVDALVLPSVDESFGQVLVEAMACSTPVIAVARGGPLRIVQTAGRDANGWLVEPDDLNALTAALETVANAPDLARRLGEQGRRHVEVHYSWRSAFEAISVIYRGVLAPPE